MKSLSIQLWPAWDAPAIDIVDPAIHLVTADDPASLEAANCPDVSSKVSTSLTPYHNACVIHSLPLPSSQEEEGWVQNNKIFRERERQYSQS